MRLILVRHGETLCNRADIWHGWDDCALTERGRAQAAAVATRLAGEEIAAIYSSDSRRAMETAHAIARLHGLDPTPDRGLRERNAGEFEGLLLAEVVARYPAVWEDRAADYWGWSPPGGETFRQVLARSLAVIDRIRGHHAGQTIVVASHMGVVRALISHLAAVPLESTYHSPFPSTGVTIFSFDGDIPRAEMLNDAAHVGGQ